MVATMFVKVHQPDFTPELLTDFYNFNPEESSHRQFFLDFLQKNEQIVSVEITKGFFMSLKA